MTKINVGGYTRITKNAAIKRILAGQIVLLCPVNYNPLSPYAPITHMTCPGGCDVTDVKKHINAYTFYNCTNADTGRYPAFYIEEDNNNA